MNIQEWNARKGTGGSLQRFLRSRGRYLHVSCDAGMREVPSETDPEVMVKIPYIQSPGTTYDIGRNKAKRANQYVSRARATAALAGRHEQVR